MLVGAAVAQIRTIYGPFPSSELSSYEADAILACFREPGALGSNFVFTNAGCSC
jgi:hypothetical protein